MSFAIKYRLEFSDRKATVWKVDFLENNFAGTITDLKAQGSPLTFHYDNNEDSPFDPIRESHCSINVWSMTNFALQDIYSIEILQFQVNIYADDVLYWWGYVEPQQYKEGYDMPPYRVTISCTDGLSVLNTEYKNGDNYYTGRRYESQIVLDCLGKIGHTEFIEFVNVYEDAFNKTVDDSVFDQVLIETFVLRGLSCIEVLAEILQKYNAFIRQKDGVFNIVRPKELVGPTVYGRHFTAYDTKTSVTITPLQYIKRSAYSSNRIQVPGGVLMIQPPVNTVKISHNYGYASSWIRNYQFKGETLSGYILSGYNFEEWINYGYPAIDVLGKESSGDNAGLMIPYNADPTTNYIYQIFGVNAKVSSLTTGDYFALEFDYMFINRGIVARANVQLKIDITDGTNHLSVSYGNLVWGAGLGYVEILATAELGSPNWVHVKMTFRGLPSAGPYTIKIFPLFNSLSTIYLGIKDIKFYCSSVNLVKTLIGTMPVIKDHFVWYWPWSSKQKGYEQRAVYQQREEIVTIYEKEYTSVNSINGVNIKLSTLLGDVLDNAIDNIPEQFSGSLGRGSLTLLYRIDDIVLTTDTGTGQADITNNGFTETAIWNTSLEQTATDFIANHNSDFAGVSVTSGGIGIIRFTHLTAGVEFTGPTSIVSTAFDLDGYVSSTQPYLTETPTITPTATWSSRGAGEEKALLQFVADEVKDMYARPKQLIQMPIIESAKALQINILGNFQDAVNLYFGAMRIFVMNRGTFDVRNRKWDIDLFEVGVGAVPTGGSSTTADSTTVHVDDTTVTVDSTI